MHASGARLGRIIAATAAAVPGGKRHPRSSFSLRRSKVDQHTSHAAVTGTSLIGWIASISATGLVATQTAARTAAGGPAMRSASTPVAQTASANETGTISDAPMSPPAAWSGAINSGRPTA